MSDAATYRCVNEPEFHYKGYRSVNGYGFEVCITCGHIFSQEKGPELDKARAELSHLQKLCEEQKGEIARLKNSVPGSVKSYIAQIEHLNRKVEALEWAIGEWKKEECLWKEREANLLSQIATQTERANRLEKALHYFQEHGYSRRVCCQALNQESLGDGK